MAARLRLHHQDEVREKIRASQLVNRLQDHAFGKNEMSATQLKAAEVLLRKCVADLSSVQIGGSLEHNVSVTIKGA